MPYPTRDPDFEALRLKLGKLRAEAEETRRCARSEAERRAAVLAVTLMMPLGLCILPAFLLLGVMPLMLAVISSSISLL